MQFLLEFPFELVVGILKKVTGNYISITQILVEEIPIDDFDTVAQPQDGDQHSAPQVAQGIEFNVAAAKYT
jgi:hypothetical protein